MTTVEGTSVPRFRIQSRFLNDLRRRFGRIVIIFLAAIIPMFLFRACFLQYMEPDTIALRQISFGPSKGLQKELVTPGYRRAVTGYERIHAFPRDIQIVEFTNTSSESNDSHRMLPAINCPTVDGYPVAIDVSVLYRVADPFRLVSKFGFGRGYEDGVVIRFTDPAIKHYLGELRAEEFYSEARLAKIQLAKKELAGRFKENGLELNDILISTVRLPGDVPDAHRAEEDSGSIGPDEYRSRQTGRSADEIEPDLRRRAEPHQPQFCRIPGADHRPECSAGSLRKAETSRSRPVGTRGGS